MAKWKETIPVKEGWLQCLSTIKRKAAWLPIIEGMAFGLSSSKQNVAPVPNCLHIPKSKYITSLSIKTALNNIGLNQKLL